MQNTNSPSAPLIPPRFLFRFSGPLHYREKLWTADGASLGPQFALLNPAALDGRRALAEVRMAWSNDGLAFSLTVEGKRQPVWCRESRLDDSDGLQLWIDTRDTQTIHRASRFCHRFAFLPAGGGRSYTDPVADQMLINRARENARPVRPKDLQVRGQVRPGGYTLSGLVPAGALTGFDPAEQSRIGFTYQLLDRELGLQTFSVGEGFPYAEDPSSWATLELVK